MLNPVELGQRIRWAREQAELTQLQVANAMGVTMGAVSAWETGHAKSIKADLLFKLADVLRCSARWLATEEGEPYPAPSADLSELSDDQRQLVLNLINTLKR